MKKLIMFCAMAALILSGSAATLDWKLTVASGQKTYKVMMFDYTKLATIQGILDAGGASTYSLLEAQALKNNAGAATFATGAKSQTLNTQNLVTTMGTDMFAVIFATKDTAEIVDGMTYGMSGKLLTGTNKWIYDGDADPPQVSPGMFEVNMSEISQTSKTIGGDVPEPTSGLLMLVGASLLALRRRRA